MIDQSVAAGVDATFTCDYTKLVNDVQITWYLVGSPDTVAKAEQTDNGE